MGEIWKDIPGYEGLYIVSNMGNIKSLYDGSHDTYREKLLKPAYYNGYYKITLSLKGIHKKHYVHRLVLLSFLGLPPDGTECNHIDGNRGNNTLNNLEYCTRSQNILHSYHVLKNRNKENYYNEKQVIQMDLQGNFIFLHKSISTASKLVGANKSNICKCCKRIYGYNSSGGYKWKYYE